LVLLLASKMERIKQLQATAEKLKKSLDEMDEQAKLIVRTDMELTKTQEELDKKVAGLYALQRLSRAISTTLQESKIFRMINAADLEDLGFEKACGFLWNEKEKRFVSYIHIGYTGDEIGTIESSLEADKILYLEFIKKAETISSISIKEGDTLHGKTTGIFKVTSFALSPILPKEGDQGFLFVGTEGLELVADRAGGLVGDGFDELFARAVEDDGGGEDFAEGGVAGEAEFLEEFVDEAVGVAGDDAEGVAADVGGAGGAEFDDDMAGVLGGAFFIQVGVFAQAGGEGVVAVKRGGGGLGGRGGLGHRGGQALSLPMEPVGQISRARWAASSSSGVSGCLKK